MALSKQKSGGSFRERKNDVIQIKIADFSSPWNFFNLFLQDDDIVFEWLRNNGLLASTIKCPKCTDMVLCKIRKRQGKCDGFTFRCENNPSHEFAMRKYSWFERSHLKINDAMNFAKSYIEGHSLKMCATHAGICYNSTAVDWGVMIREIFKEYFYRTVSYMKLSGEVEIDESLFGRRVKYHRGNPHVGCKIWIFGMIERSTDKFILYPVENRSEELLTSIIEKHIEKGSTIFSDGWSAYYNLNKKGYDHFTVLHKFNFKKVYIHKVTKERKEVHTNRIEGSWKHAKDYFRKMSGTSKKHFEGHLSEVIWRNHSSKKPGNIYEHFFDMLRELYTLDEAAEYAYTTPLFSTWDFTESNNETDAITVIPELSDNESSTPSDTSEEEISNGLESVELSDILESEGSSNAGRPDSDDTCDLDNTLTSVGYPHPQTSSPQVQHEHNQTSTCVRPKSKQSKSVEALSRTQNVCCPSEFIPERKEKRALEKRRKKTTSNPYSKSAFLWGNDWSEDDDFI